MYIPTVHAEGSILALRKLIRENPLGILTTGIRSSNAPFLQSSPVPFILEVSDEEDEADLGILRAHLARQNPQSKAMIESLQSRPASSPAEANVLEDEVLIYFQSAAQHYVTPKFYVETKPSSGKVVPTWNYAAAQVYGRAKVFWDHKSDESIAFLSRQTAALSQYCEASVMGYDGTNGRPAPWEVSDAPERYVELLRKGIIGIEIKIERLEGRTKMSQEMPAGDRQGVIQGFKGLDNEVACKVSELVKERDRLKTAKAS